MKKQSQNSSTQSDYEEPHVHDIIPANEEYYTLELTRSFDNDEDDESGVDLADKDPQDLSSIEQSPKSSSFYEDGVIVSKQTSSNQVDEDNDLRGVEVGTPGHWGFDDDTE